MMRFTTSFGSGAAVVLGLLAFTACSSTANVATPPTTTVPASAGCGSNALHFAFAVYADATHQQEQCEFSLASNATAYVLMQNGATSEHYVMTVQSAGVHPFCAYMSPPGRSALPTHAPGNSALCNPTTENVTGVLAAGGDVLFSWPIKPTLHPGNYTVGILDQNANAGIGASLGAIQVRLTP